MRSGRAGVLTTADEVVSPPALNLPRLSEVDSLRMRRFTDRAPDGSVIPTIAITAYYESYPPAQMSGWAADFQKPLQIEQLVDTIAAILGRSRGRDR